MKKENITAIIVGASGLVGSNLVRLCLDDSRFSTVKAFIRKPLAINHPKLKQYVINFEQLDNYQSEFSADVLFSALGTTKAIAGSREKQRSIDYYLQYKVASLAHASGVSAYVLISAPGASPRSPFAYTRMKGDLERDVLKLGFKQVIFLRPSLLQGKREDKRHGEEIAGKLLKHLPLLPGLETLKPVTGLKVAQAAIAAAFKSTPGITTLNPRDILLNP